MDARWAMGVRVMVGSVWLVFGLGFKVLNLVPRHRLIVASVLGEGVAGPVTVLIGLAEVVLGAWVIWGKWPRVCAAVQTCAIVAMNVLEILFAREHLLSPVGMVCANTVLLTLVWWAAVSHQGEPKAS